MKRSALFATLCLMAGCHSAAPDSPRTRAEQLPDEVVVLEGVKISSGSGMGRVTPNLGGEVTSHANDRLVIELTSNPDGVDIQQAIERFPVSFAIYDENGYKGEALVEKFEPSANTITAKVLIRRGDTPIQNGDQAATIH